MADQFLAEIRIVPFNFAPTGWALCNGALMPISQNTALFSLLGTTYGGDGRTTFGLPNFDGRMPMHAGGGPGLTTYFLGESGGSETTTLLSSQIPSHGHVLNASTQAPPSSSPASGVFGATPERPFHPGPADTTLSPATLAPAGGSLPHNNLSPYLAMTFIIALQGIFPPRP